MSLLTTLNDDIKTAMKSKDKDRLAVLRMLKTAIQNEQIKAGRDLNEEDELTVVSREMKQRKESLHEFEKAGRDDLVEKAKIEIAVVQKYLPEQLSTEEIQQIVEEAIASTGATSANEFGKVMGAVMPKVKGRADGAKINAIVKDLLQQQ